VFVSYDGRGTICVSPDELMDDDDHLGQIILHELCHHLVEGDASRHAPDWGLDNTSGVHDHHERAALRVQAKLCDLYGGPHMRAHMVATTDFRPYYEQLGPDPLAGDDLDAIALANAALARLPSWHLLAHLIECLDAERQMIAF
jgi:hypothetical protein